MSEFRFFTFIFIIPLIFSCSSTAVKANKSLKISPVYNTLNEKRWVTGKTGLILRNGPEKTAEKIELIPLFSEVHCLKEISEAETIDGKPGKWNYVEWEGKKGWAFGGYLSVVKPKFIADLQKTVLNYYSNNSRTKHFYGPKFKSEDIIIKQILGKFAVVKCKMYGPIDGDENYEGDTLWIKSDGGWNELKYDNEMGLGLTLLYLNNDNYVDYVSAYGCCNNDTVEVYLGGPYGHFEEVFTSLDIGDTGFSADVKNLGKCGKTVIYVSNNKTTDVKKFRFDCKDNAMVPIKEGK